MKWTGDAGIIKCSSQEWHHDIPIQRRRRWRLCLLLLTRRWRHREWEEVEQKLRSFRIINKETAKEEVQSHSTFRHFMEMDFPKIIWGWMLFSHGGEWCTRYYMHGHLLLPPSIYSLSGSGGLPAMKGQEKNLLAPRKQFKLGWIQSPCSRSSEQGSGVWWWWWSGNCRQNVMMSCRIYYPWWIGRRTRC